MVHSSETSSVVLLIPAYNPVSSLPEMVSAAVSEKPFCAAIVVDDGSSPEHRPVFDRMESMEHVTVIRHDRNMGKGQALKTGFQAVLKAFPESVGVVTADADGQHLVEDIGNVANRLVQSPDKLILGARTFGKDVPLRSLAGNVVTRYVMRFFTGQKISDTQTGLRGVPAFFLPEVIGLKTGGYEYEIDMLMRSKGVCEIEEVPIQTVYLDGNATSHFNPLLDSMRIYLVVMRFAISSLVSAVVDNILFALVFLLCSNIAVSQVVGRVGSLFLNFFLNKNAVFHSSASVSSSMGKYIGLVVFSGLISYGMITLLVSMGTGVFVAKLLAETVMFFFNFIVQRRFVFMNTKLATGE